MLHFRGYLGNAVLNEDEFNERIARVRQRFAAALPQKIEGGLAALPRLADSDADAIETLVVTHRSLHEMCGIAPSVGFAATGTAARTAETVLREPAKAKRPLTPQEITAYRTAIENLRNTAQSELESIRGRG